MNILIVGGSNSLLSGGYVQHLQRTLTSQGDCSISQLSVGATTTLSAVGRLFDTQRQQLQVDVILYEYAINDAGHFAWRSGGAESWRLCLHLMIKAAAQLYPNAVLVPLMLAQEGAFDAALAYPFYELQLATFAELGLYCIDMRAWLSELFLGQKPDWLYSDPAHYAVPQASGIIGAVVARHLLALTCGQPETLSVSYARLQASSPFAGVELAYVPAQNLAQFASGPVEHGHDANRLMQLDYLRLHPGSRLQMRTEMYPLALFIKSDAQHDHAILTLAEQDGAVRAMAFGTRHADTASYRFIYASVPLPFLWEQTLMRQFGACTFDLALPPRGQPDQPAVNFDCFGHGLPSASEQYLDLVSVLFVVGAARATPASPH